MTKAERACQIWAVLAWAAKSQQVLTYGQLGRLIGMPAAGLGQVLEPIQSYCALYKLPPLTVLVVSQARGMPGAGFIGASASELGQAQVEVFQYDWLGKGNPGAEDLGQAVQTLPTNAVPQM